MWREHNEKKSQHEGCNIGSIAGVGRLRQQALSLPDGKARVTSITASILYNLVHCPQRVALDAFGNPKRQDEPNAFVRLLWERGALYERETIAKLQLPFIDLSSLDGTQREAATLDAMGRGEPLIYGGRISADDLLGLPDLLRQQASGYVPGDIKSGAGEEGGGEDTDGKPKLQYAVQLALYIDILERHALSAGRRAFVWDIHGQEVPYNFSTPQGPKRPKTLWDAYQTALKDARGILARQSTPQGAYASPCKHCHGTRFALIP